MKIAVPKERAAGERRVALVPEIVAKFVKGGHTVAVERGAGTSAGYTDAAYETAGATLVPDARTAYDGADVVARVAKPTDEELEGIPKGAVLVGFLAPLGDPQSVERYAQRGLTALSMETIPRTTKAQAMDALSSQANIGGYKAVLLAANHLPKFFPMLTTAAGTIAPAKALIIGAGVAGLQAIATARRLGAVVTAYDTRAVVAEQVKSLGAKFLEIDVGESGEGAGGYARELSPEAIAKQRAAMVKAIGGSDVVITTAAIPGKRAPILVTREAVAAMAPGSVIVDLAAETGGNVEGTQPGEVVTSENGVTIVGPLNLASSLAYDASRLYARNVQALLDYVTKDGALALDPNDEIVAGSTLTRDGEVVHAATRAALSGDSHSATIPGGAA
ncbi:MAG TPA: Re/Si-specific NAD(P)(+) transhydrogenase subunit alpha [Candidatus Elarobacter sp.]|jgi:NAD(P) transhydrogenase subunit alpha|nr:Re/Si-specific NAD(P)(+) transhydrogenase subunit alpha [Candidatus Elarobacter sp.]